MLSLVIQVVLATCPWPSLLAPRPDARAVPAAALPSLDAAALLPTRPSDPFAAAGLHGSGAEIPSSFGATSAPARREDPEEGEDYANIYPKFSVGVGWMLLNNFNSSFQVSGAAGVGTIIDMEDLLDVDDDTTAGRLDLHYSFNKRHWIDAAYFDFERSGSTGATSQDIDFGDITIPAGAAVTADVDTMVVKLAYRYNFVTDSRTVIGASFGLHTMGLRVKLDAAALAVDETFRQELPLPLIGLHGAYALSRKWSLRADAEILQFDLGDYGGFVSDNQLALNHDSFDHFGWGLSLTSFRMNADAEGEDGLEAEFDYAYQGIMLYLRYYM